MKRLMAALAVLTMYAGPVSAQTMQHDPAMTMQHHGAGASPTEAGQGAFAAIQEIVAILEADPHTDWSKVDIDTLRTHLVDMNVLTLSAVVRGREVPGGLEMTVDGAGRAGEAARRMIPAHAAELAKMEGWTATGIVSGDDAVLIVTSSDAAQTARIRGLGFFGLMASGAHHQPHHLGMARGEMVH